MIEIKNLTKQFGDFKAIDKLDCTILKGNVYGLVGVNGAGKSTLLRTIAGIYEANEGEVLIEGVSVFDNAKIKNKIAFVPDDLFFLKSCNLKRMSKLYSACYKNFSFEKFENLLKLFKLDKEKNINTFSKGMKRQASTILALSTNAEYLLLDETFDGLDPIMRNLLKDIIYREVYERKATAVISSHALRELEDTCDQLALMHKGGIILESDVSNLKTSLYKVQVAFSDEFDKSKFDDIEVLKFKMVGKVASLIVRSQEDDVLEKIKAKTPILLEVLPLTLEEIFIYEMNALGIEYGEEDN